MNIEIVWLAYDRDLVEGAWSRMTVKELYQYLINDRFRKRVDPRSMLFHSKQSDILNEVEKLIKHGAINFNLEEYLSRLFYHGEDKFPLASGELEFDLGLISCFTSWRMADDYQMVEGFFDKLFKKMGIIKALKNFSFFELGDLDAFADNLREVKVQHIVDVVESDSTLDKGIDTYVRLVQNYIEFFNYYKNNHLKPFFYNSETDIRKWGNLVERQNERSARIVNMAYKKVRETLGKTRPKKDVIQAQQSDKVSLISRFKQKRRIENLIVGIADPDPLIRQKACEYLGTFGAEEDIPHLVKALGDPEAEVRQEAAKALGEMGDKKTVSVLIDRMLKDESVNVVTSCAQALSNIGDSKAILALVEAMTKGMYHLAVPIAFYPAIRENKQAVSVILRASRDQNVNLRRQIAFILGELKTKESVNELLQRLEDDDRDVKINAIYSLGRIGSREAIQNLKKFAEKSSDEEIKKSFQRALSLPTVSH